MSQYDSSSALSRLREEAIELGQYFFADHVVHLAESIDPDPRNEGRRRREHYAAGQMLHKVFLIGEADANHHLAFVERSRNGGPTRGLPSRSSADLVACEWDKCVPVERRHLVKNPKGFRLRSIPSVVWLHRLDYVLRFLRDVPDPLFDGGWSSFREDWELNAVENVVGDSGVKQRHLVDEAIERTSQILDKIAENGSETERRLGCWRELQLNVLKTRFVVSHDTVWVALLESPEPPIKLIQMHSCASELRCGILGGKLCPHA